MQRIVISASRRTDIPAFYMPWFMEQIARGFFEIDHPFGRPAALVSATPDQVHTIVFWSKDFGSFLDGGYDRQLAARGYNLFFNFTINSPDATLEPDVPALGARLDQLSRLSDRFGPQSIFWRFDPICYFQHKNGATSDNLASFAAIAKRAAAAGIRVCITSFVDLYRKVQRRAAAADIVMIDPPLAQKARQVTDMAHELEKMRIQLHLCCEKDLLAFLPPGANVHSAACIPNRLLAMLYGPDISVRKDSGQRVAAGCGCRLSKDIGSYRLHPCRHNCLFCYANSGK
jgi:hypothetical protein